MILSSNLLKHSSRRHLALNLCYRLLVLYFFFNDTATTEIYTLSLHDALPIFAADDLKDAVYGQGHIGGGSELRYGPYVAAHYGLHLGMESLPSASQAIINRIRFWLLRQTPVIITMHSKWSTPWVQDGGDGLHVGTAYAISETDRGMLHIANPWREFDHAQPVSWWRARLGEGVWPVQRIVTNVLGHGIDKWTDDGVTLLETKGQRVDKGFREKVLADAATAQGWQGGMPYGPEWGDATGSRQLFAAEELIWTPQTGVQVGTMVDVLALAEHLREGKAA